MNIRPLLAAALLPMCFTAQADEADGSHLPIAFESTRSVAEVRAEARTAPRISNGGTGFIGVTASQRTPAEVRAEAAAALRDGRIPSGERSPVM